MGAQSVTGKPLSPTFGFLVISIRKSFVLLIRNQLSGLVTSCTTNFFNPITHDRSKYSNNQHRMTQNINVIPFRVKEIDSP